MGRKKVKLNISRKFLEVPDRIYEEQILEISGTSELVTKVDKDAFDSPFHTLQRETPIQIYEYDYSPVCSNLCTISPGAYYRSVANIYEKGHSAGYNEKDSRLKEAGL